jgi:lysozyme
MASPNKDLKLSPAGANLIKHFESCLKPVPGRKGYYTAYRDPVGVVTICWGFTNAVTGGRRVKMGDVWSRMECDESFAFSMHLVEGHVRRLVKVPLNQKQFDALVSFTFNLGPGNFGKSTLLKRINAKDFAGAANEFKRWNKAGGRVLAGLTRRRNSEANVFSGRPDPHYKA